MNARKQKIASFFAILIGFGIGQGSFFFVQTYYVYIGDFEYLAQIGILLAFLSLAQWVGDGGGVLFLSKFVSSTDVQQRFFEFCTARVISTLVIMIPILSVISFFDNSFVITAVFMIAVGVVWSFNANGLLDSTSKNFISGPLNSLPWLLSSVVVISFHKDKDIEFYVFSSYMVGLLFCLLYQLCSLNFKIKEMRFSYNAAYFNDVLSYSASYLLSQAFGRMMLYLVNAFLGASISGQFVYAKNLANFFGQLVTFIRRVEFNSLVNLAGGNGLNYKAIYARQKNGIAFVFFVFLFSFAFFLGHVFELYTAQVDLIEMLFICSCLLLIWVIVSSLSQYLLALGKSNAVLLINLASIVFSGFLLLYFLLNNITVHKFFIVEAIMYSIQLVLFALYINSLKKRNIENFK